MAQVLEPALACRKRRRLARCAMRVSFFNSLVVGKARRWVTRQALSPGFRMRFVVVVPATAGGVGEFDPLGLPGMLNMGVAKNHVGPDAVPRRRSARIRRK